MTNPFRGRKDTEHVQALVRLIIVLLIVLYWAISSSAHFDRLSLVLIFTELLIAVGILCHIAIAPRINHPRRVIGMLADYSMMAAAMWHIGQTLAPVYIVIMWVTVGNGLRYGARYLTVAVCFSFVSFAIVITSTPYWKNNPQLAYGLLLGLVAIPGYLMSLLRSLNRATAEVRRANQAKSQFIASMSHEIRTPITGVLGMAELLQGTPLDERQRDYAGAIRQAGNHLLRLVNDALDLSRVEAGQLALERVAFDLRNLLDEALALIQPAAERKHLALGLEWASDLPRLVVGDPGRLRQILLNLCSNAVKFTDQGAVTVRVALSGKVLCFAVADTGPGISQDQQNRLFRRYRQTEEGQRRGGSGLGLAISRELVEAMGGQMTMRSTSGHGCVVRFDLPLERAESFQLPESAAVDTLQRKGLRLLLVEDDPIVARVIVDLLRMQGHAIEHVSHSLAALTRLESTSFDVMLLDLDLPALGGLELARMLRNKGLTLPILAVTARSDAEAKDETQRAGFNGFVRKPVSGELLRRAIEEAASGVGAVVRSR